MSLHLRSRLHLPRRATTLGAPPLQADLVGEKGSSPPRGPLGPLATWAFADDPAPLCAGGFCPLSSRQLWPPETASSARGSGHPGFVLSKPWNPHPPGVSPSTGPVAGARGPGGLCPSGGTRGGSQPRLLASFCLWGLRRTSADMSVSLLLAQDHGASVTHCPVVTYDLCHKSPMASSSPHSVT